MGLMRLLLQFMNIALAGKDSGEFQSAPLPRNSAVAQQVETPDVAPGNSETR